MAGGKGGKGGNLLSKNPPAGFVNDFKRLTRRGLRRFVENRPGGNWPETGGNPLTRWISMHFVQVAWELLQCSTNETTQGDRMEIGVFIPIGNNGWLISSTSPQYTPSFDLNREVVLRAERYGFDFALSMIKLRGFGGKSRYWDDNLESFTLMAGLASITSRIELYATVAVLTMPPPLTARMAMTIDSISHGRFGVNLVTGWQKAEYDQMGIWPGDEHFKHRYEALDEYATVMSDLWTHGQSDLKASTTP
jgi:hypothetical protein